MIGCVFVISRDHGVHVSVNDCDFCFDDGETIQGKRNNNLQLGTEERFNLSAWMVSFWGNCNYCKDSLWSSYHGAQISSAALLPRLNDAFSVRTAFTLLLNQLHVAYQRRPKLRWRFLHFPSSYSQPETADVPVDCSFYLFIQVQSYFKFWGHLRKRVALYKLHHCIVPRPFSKSSTTLGVGWGRVGKGWDKAQH